MNRNFSAKVKMGSPGWECWVIPHPALLLMEIMVLEVSPRQYKPTVTVKIKTSIFLVETEGTHHGETRKYKANCTGLANTEAE